MIVYHVTTIDRIPSICETGIDPTFSRGKTKECWFVCRDKVEWAILHVMDKNKTDMAGVVVIEVEAKSRLLRKRWKSIYSSLWKVPPCDLLSFNCGTVFARRYPDDCHPDMMKGG